MQSTSRHRAFIGLEVSLEDERAWAVTTLNAAHLTNWHNLPMAVAFRTKESGKERG